MILYASFGGSVFFFKTIEEKITIIESMGSTNSRRQYGRTQA